MALNVLCIVIILACSTGFIWRAALVFSALCGSCAVYSRGVTRDVIARSDLQCCSHDANLVFICHLTFYFTNSRLLLSRVSLYVV